MTLAADIRAKVDASCIVRRVNKKGCRLRVTGIRDGYVAIDLDHTKSPAPKNEIKCDYLFAGQIENDGLEYLSAIELKAGSVEASEAHRQLQAGANLAQEFAPRHNARFVAMVASDRINKAQRAALKATANQVIFRNSKYEIVRLKCGAPLVDALGS